MLMLSVVLLILVRTSLTLMTVILKRPIYSSIREVYAPGFLRALGSSLTKNLMNQVFLLTWLTFQKLDIYVLTRSSIISIYGYQSY